jgi:6-pyruvoyltetrahydropterin/6-carboxytetrahydropterin synthase
VPEFLTLIPTTENIAIAIWRRLAPKLKSAQLHRVRVYETPDLFVDVFGEENHGDENPGDEDRRSKENRGRA